MHVAVEREAKLDADPGYVLPDLRPVVGKTRVLEPLELWSSYVDTRDLRLWGRGITLRHRSGESDAQGVWTLKLPHGDAAVGTERAERTWPGTVDQIPTEVRQLLLGIVRLELLVVVAELECHRRRVRLLEHDGTPVGEVDDDTVTVHGGGADGRRFREVELEVRTWDARTRQVLELLVAAGARPGPPAPKLARALGDRSTVPDGTQADEQVRPTIGDVLRTAVGTGLDRILDNDLLLRMHPGEPPVEAVHRARVAARRLRSELRTLSPLLDPMWATHVRADLHWFGSALGRVRDADVLTTRLRRERADGTVDSGGLAVLLAGLGVERQEGARALGAVVESRRYLSLLDKLHAATTRPPVAEPALVSAPAGDLLPALVGVAWKDLGHRVRRARKDATDRRLHKVRIGAKQLRYGAELAAPVVGAPAERTATRAARLQNVLGGHQDAVAARAWLGRWAEDGPTIAAFAAGQVSAVEAQRRTDARRRWGKRWRRLTTRHARSWLRHR